MSDTENENATHGGGTTRKALVNENGEIWAAGHTDLEHKLEILYGVDRLWLQGDYREHESDETYYEVLLYYDGEDTHLIDDDLRMLGHSESGAWGVEYDSLPDKGTVKEAVKGANGGE